MRGLYGLSLQTILNFCLSLKIRSKAYEIVYQNFDWYELMKQDFKGTRVRVLLPFSISDQSFYLTVISDIEKL